MTHVKKGPTTDCQDCGEFLDRSYGNSLWQESDDFLSNTCFEYRFISSSVGLLKFVSFRGFIQQNRTFELFNFANTCIETVVRMTALHAEVPVKPKSPYVVDHDAIAMTSIHFHKCEEEIIENVTSLSIANC